MATSLEDKLKKLPITRARKVQAKNALAWCSTALVIFGNFPKESLASQAAWGPHCKGAAARSPLPPIPYAFP